MTQNIERIIDDLVNEIKEQRSYQEYVKERERVEGHQDVLDKIDEIRKLNLKLQSIQNSDQAYDEQDRLEKRYDELSEDQRVFDFIEAENRFIGMYQEIYRRIMEEIELI